MRAGQVLRGGIAALAGVFLLAAGAVIVSTPTPASAQQGFQTMNWCVNLDDSSSGVTIVSTCSGLVNVAWCEEGEEDFGMCGDQNFRYLYAIPTSGRRSLGASGNAEVHIFACEHPGEPRDLTYYGQQLVGRCG